VNLKIRQFLDPPEKIFAWAIMAALALAFFASSARAADPLNDQPNWVTARFFSAPTSVLVDVLHVESGTTVATNLTPTQLSIDGQVSPWWRFDLSIVNGYPTGCELATYVVRFEPLGADCQESADGSDCAWEERQVGGSSCFATGISTHYVHTSTVVSGQGIDQDVLNFYTARGVLPLLWIEISRSSSYDYSAADSTTWEVYFYTSSASAVRILCTVKTNVDPGGALPSYTHCS